jgi:hypothetical protein
MPDPSLPPVTASPTNPGHAQLGWGWWLARGRPALVRSRLVRHPRPTSMTIRSTAVAARSRADSPEQPIGAVDESLEDDVDDLLDEELDDDAFAEDDDLDDDAFSEEVEEIDDDLDDEDADADLSVAEAADEGEEDDEDVVLETAVVPPDAAFDDDEDEIVAAVTVEDDDGEEVDGIRDGEFVCRGCHLAMRDTQLADAKAMLCRDCV